MQEELALVMRQLNAPEDALVQYDELDAILTQSVLNSAQGGGAFCISALKMICKQQKFRNFFVKQKFRDIFTTERYANPMCGLFFFNVIFSIRANFFLVNTDTRIYLELLKITIWKIFDI